VRSTIVGLSECGGCPDVVSAIGIIGAGISGLTVARALTGLATVRLFEKGHRVGGRVATRSIEAVTFDHGAQYFTIRDDRFRDTLEIAREKRIVEPFAVAFYSTPEKNLSSARPPKRSDTSEAPR
jgi:renalase